MDILVLSWDGGGNVPPMLGLGAELRQRGHRIRFLAPEALRPGVIRAGLDFRPLLFGLDFSHLDRRSSADQAERLTAIFLGEGYSQDLRAEVAQRRPDVAVVDASLQAAQAAAAALGVPYALLVHTVPSLYLAVWRRNPEALATVRVREGLPPVRSPEEIWATAAAVLVAGTPLLDPQPVTAIPGVRYVGPIFEPDDLSEPLPVEVTTPGAPLVLIGLSTTYMEGQQDLLDRVIRATGDLPVRALGTAGPGVGLQHLPLPPNVTLHGYLPHSRVLPHAAVMVAHAGHSSVVRALSAGIPLVCIPLGRDQAFNATQVQAIGAGLALPADADPKAIAKAITTVLGDGAYRTAAQRAAEAIASLGPSAAAAAGIVESVAQRGDRPLNL